MTDVPVITNDLPVSQNIQAAPNDNLIGQMQKEQEPIAKTENQTLQDLMPEMNISPELTNIGIEKISETINLPSDLKKTGVEAVGPSQPVAQTPHVVLPISDYLVVKGKSAKMMSSFYWLYVWCIRQLKKAHLHLKNMGGKIVREKD